MNRRPKQNPSSSQVAIAIAAALLGLLLAINAMTVEQPLKTINTIGAVLFLLTANASILKTEG